MKKFIVILMLAFSFASCSTSKSTASGSSEDGLSFETAVVIQEKTETKGVNAEYAWIDKHYSNHKVQGQSLVTHERKRYDIITITQGGKEIKLYFNIDNFFGKF